MNVQNISGPDIVNATVQNGNAAQQNENVQTTDINQPEIVNEQDKGDTVDSYA